MKLTNLEISNILSAYNANLKSEMKLPISIAWKRKKNIKKLQSIWEAADEMIKELKDKYFVDGNTFKDEKGRVCLKEEHTAELLNEQNEIMKQENEIEIATVKIEELGDISLTDLDMETISFMIEE